MGKTSVHVRLRGARRAMKLLSWAVCFALVAASCVADDTDANSRSSWSISREATVEIGLGGGPSYEFHRVVGIGILPNSNIVVADAGSQELRIFSDMGQIVRSFGGPGDGPGEFRNISGIRIVDDSIFVSESFPAAPKIHVFDAQRGFLAQQPLRPQDQPSGVAPYDILSSTTVVVVPGRGLRIVATPPREGIVRRDSLKLGVLEVGKEQHVTWLGLFPNNSWYSYPLPPGSSVSRSMARYSLGPSLVVRTSGHKIWIGDSGTGDIGLWDPARGAQDTTVSFPQGPRGFDQPMLRRAMNEARTNTSLSDPAAPARIEELYSDRLLPATAPRFTRFTPGPDGEMWIECFSEIPTEEHCVFAFDERGRVSGDAMVPAGVQIEAVDADRIIGVRRRSYGMETVVVHRLIRH
ncbi:MAG TPA: 6-bladed beta-propeller [Gemmatimonadales bacterium]